MYATINRRNFLSRSTLADLASSITPFCGCSAQAFFERGAINSPEDIRTHLERTFPGRAGELPAVASRCEMHQPSGLMRAEHATDVVRWVPTCRLESVVTKLDAEGGFVGLLPSNVRLGLEHKPHLSQLLSWLNDPKASRASGTTAGAVY